MITAGPAGPHNLMGITFPPHLHLLILTNILYLTGHVFNITAPFCASLPLSQTKTGDWRALTWRLPRNNVIISLYVRVLLYVFQRITLYTVSHTECSQPSPRGRATKSHHGFLSCSGGLPLTANPLYGDTQAGGERVVRSTTNQ